MTVNEKFLNQRQRYRPVTLPQDFSDVSSCSPDKQYNIGIKFTFASNKLRLVFNRYTSNYVKGTTDCKIEIFMAFPGIRS